MPTELSLTINMKVYDVWLCNISNKYILFPSDYEFVPVTFINIFSKCQFTFILISNQHHHVFIPYWAEIPATATVGWHYWKLLERTGVLTAPLPSPHSQPSCCDYSLFRKSPFRMLQSCADVRGTGSAYATGLPHSACVPWLNANGGPGSHMLGGIKQKGIMPPWGRVNTNFNGQGM